MSFLNYLVAILIIAAFVKCDDNTNKLDDEPTTPPPTESDLYLTSNKNATPQVEKVELKVYYESLCPYCIRFFHEHLREITTSLHEYLDIHLYPYGNADTDKVDDHYVITCQHGEEECYGNKLHACAIDILKNVTKSTLYNCCLMPIFSNDDAAAECGESMKIDPNPIKECAKGDRGNELLKYYGEENNKVNYRGVPCVYINGTRYREDFKKTICSLFNTPPPPCKGIV